MTRTDWKWRTKLRESDATRTLTTRKSQPGQKKPTSPETRTSRNQESAQEEVCNACQEHGKVTRKSQPVTGERRTENQSARKEAKEGVCRARNSNPIAADDGRCEQKNTEWTDVKDKEKQPGMGPDDP